MSSRTGSEDIGYGSGSVDDPIEIWSDDDQDVRRVDDDGDHAEHVVPTATETASVQSLLPQAPLLQNPLPQSPVSEVRGSWNALGHDEDDDVDVEDDDDYEAFAGTQASAPDKLAMSSSEIWSGNTDYGYVDIRPCEDVGHRPTTRRQSRENQAVERFDEQAQNLRNMARARKARSVICGELDALVMLDKGAYLREKAEMIATNEYQGANGRDRERMKAALQERVGNKRAKDGVSALYVLDHLAQSRKYR